MNGKISTVQGLAIGLASIVGSGLFFLPVEIAKQTHSHAYLPWLFVTILCLPLVRIFTFLTLKDSTGSGVIASIYRNFGDCAGRAVSFLMIFATSFGMPIAALVAASYMIMLVPVLTPLRFPVAFFILGTAWSLNLLGLDMSKRIQVWLVILATIVVASFVFLEHSLIRLQGPIDLQTLRLSVFAAPVVFWAFAGWENLSFLANRFYNPRKQVPIVLSVTLVVSSLVYALLSVLAQSKMYSMQTSQTVAGFAAFYELNTMRGTSYVVLLSLGAAAVVTILSNLSAWIMGLSSLCAVLINQDSQSTSKRPTGLLGLGYLVGLMVITFFPQSTDFLIKGVSGSFLVTYCVCLFAYLSHELTWIDRGVGITAAFFLSVYLMTFGLSLLFPALGFLIFAFFRFACCQFR